MAGKRTITIGTRGSRLALWQAEAVAQALRATDRETEVRLEVIKTSGDRFVDVPLATLGGKGLFIKEIEEALLAGRIDLAVHSAKDLPAVLASGLTLGGVTEREDPRDALVSRTGCPFRALPAGARIGTSSLRRAAQLRYARPDLRIVPLRGNVETRLGKLETEALDAVVLAAAGLRRLGLADRITEVLPPELSLPAIGQGALAIEVREADPVVVPLMPALDHPETRACVTAERGFLQRLEASCQLPVAAYATMEAGSLRLRGLVATEDGRQLVRGERRGAVGDALAIGQALGDDLLARGGAEVLRHVYGR